MLAMILKMQQKQRLFIYDRKEMGVLLLLALLVAIFAFTLGVHLGKRVGAGEAQTDLAAATLAATEEDPVPVAQDLADQNRGAQVESDDVLDKAAHDEVGRTGLKASVRRQVELPEQSKAEKINALAEPENAVADASLQSLAAVTRAAPIGKYTLQIGSHSKIETAREQISRAEAGGLKPLMRVVELPGRGRWYRIYIGGYTGKDIAESSGRELRTRGLIDSYIVANAVR